MKISIAVILVDRANYGRLFPVMREIKLSSHLQLLTICSGTMMLEKFGYSEKVVQKDGFKINGRVYMEIEGSIPETMSKSIGLGIIGFTQEFQRLKPDMVLIIGDRYEALSACIAAAYMNLPIAHIQGGEISGSIDETTRHLITKMSHLHFPSTERSKEIIIQLGEDPKTVFNFGCPSSDYLVKTEPILDKNFFNKMGIGTIDATKPYFLVIFHPITTSYDKSSREIDILLSTLDQIKHPTVWLWPNIDAGSNLIAKKLRVFRESNNADWLCLIKNLNPQDFHKALSSSSCAIGNSSSFVRDSCFFGTPVVLVGARQNGREHGNNLVNVSVTKNKIRNAIKAQLAHGKYKPSKLYGSGKASKKIVNKLSKFKPTIQKQFHIE